MRASTALSWRKSWVEKTFPDAAPGSIETAVFISSLTTESVQRSNGLMMVSEPYLKNSEGAYIDASGTPSQTRREPMYRQDGGRQGPEPGVTAPQ